MVQALAGAYHDEMKSHGYRVSPYDDDRVCCTLPMMWKAFETLGFVELKENGCDFDFLP